jgi:hypothetical protein
MNGSDAEGDRILEKLRSPRRITEPCQVCGMKQPLCVQHHHQYGRNSWSKPHRKVVIPLCSNCHTIVHSLAKLSDFVLNDPDLTYEFIEFLQGPYRPSQASSLLELGRDYKRMSKPRKKENKPPEKKTQPRARSPLVGT